MATKKSTAKTAKKQMVLVRAYSAGVHFGELVSRKGDEVQLANARRIWRWFGANTLNEIALRGLDVSQSKVSDSVPGPSVILGVIEVHPLSADAIENLRGATWR